MGVMTRIGVAALALWAGAAQAEGGSLFGGGAAAPLVALAPAGPGVGASGSLFAGTGRGLFAPLPPRAPAASPPRIAIGPGGAEAALFDLIALAEAGPAGYDAVQHGARILPPRRPTAMTVGEILDWIAATPGQPHAIGRYQIVPGTLRPLLARHGIGREARFDAALQDRLALSLLADAGYGAFRDGTLSRRAFMQNLAEIWAGLPTASGKSHYHGYAGNRATLDWVRFDAEMARIFPGAA